MSGPRPWRSSQQLRWMHGRHQCFVRTFRGSGLRSRAHWSQITDSWFGCVLSLWNSAKKGAELWESLSWFNSFSEKCSFHWGEKRLLGIRGSSLKDVVRFLQKQRRTRRHAFYTGDCEQRHWGARAEQKSLPAIPRNSWTRAYQLNDTPDIMIWEACDRHTTRPLSEIVESPP